MQNLYLITSTQLVPVIYLHILVQSWIRELTWFHTEWKSTNMSPTVWISTQSKSTNMSTTVWISTQSKSTSLPCAVRLFGVLEANITIRFYLYKAIQNAVSMQISVALSCGQERVPVVCAVAVTSHRQKTKSESQKHNGEEPQTRHNNHWTR